MSGIVGFRDEFSAGNERQATEFLIRKQISKISTATLVKVVAVTNNGDPIAPGTVDVTPMVHQIDGDGNTMPHGVIKGIPYHRHGNGTYAIIADPKVGDIGIMVHSSRDISGVKATRDVSGPQSRRQHDWADGMYVGQTMNLPPTQYVRFTDDGIDIVVPAGKKLTISAPNFSIDSAGNVTMTGNISVSGEVTRGAGTGASVTLGSHTHGGVQRGGSNTNSPTPGT